MKWWNKECLINFEHLNSCFRRSTFCSALGNDSAVVVNVQPAVVPALEIGQAVPSRPLSQKLTTTMTITTPMRAPLPLRRRNETSKRRRRKLASSSNRFENKRNYTYCESMLALVWQAAPYRRMCCCFCFGHQTFFLFLILYLFKIIIQQQNLVLAWQQLKYNQVMCMGFYVAYLVVLNDIVVSYLLYSYFGADNGILSRLFKAKLTRKQWSRCWLLIPLVV